MSDNKNMLEIKQCITICSILFGILICILFTFALCVFFVRKPHTSHTSIKVCVLYEQPQKRAHTYTPVSYTHLLKSKRINYFYSYMPSWVLLLLSQNILGTVTSTYIHCYQQCHRPSQQICRCLPLYWLCSYRKISVLYPNFVSHRWRVTSKWKLAIRFHYTLLL